MFRCEDTPKQKLARDKIVMDFKRVKSERGCPTANFLDVKRAFLMPNRDNHSQADLKKASFHLDHELNMLFVSKVELSKTKKNSPDAIRNAYLVNAMLETFLIHARNLIDFFYNDSPRKDDVVAKDFVSDWETLRPTFTVLLVETRDNANKHLTHLTYARIDLTEPWKWHFEEIESNLVEVLNKFFETVSEECLCSEIIKTKNVVAWLR